MSPPKKRNESHRSAPPPPCAATSCRRRRKIISGRGMIFSLRTAFILAHAQGRCASFRRKPLPCAPPLSCAPLFLARFLCAQQRKRAKAACKGGAPRLGANLCLAHRYRSARAVRFVQTQTLSSFWLQTTFPSCGGVTLPQQLSLRSLRRMRFLSQKYDAFAANSVEQLGMSPA